MDPECAGVKQGAESTAYYGMPNPLTGGVDLAANAVELDEQEIFRRMNLLRPTSKYRETTVGNALITSLGELLEKGKISTDLYNKTMDQFDRTILRSLNRKLSARVTFKADKLANYKLIDNVWVFSFENVEFRENNCFANVPKLQVTAFEAKANILQNMASTGKRRTVDFEIRSSTAPRGRGRGRGRGRMMM